jgi:hypothetical protein
MSAKSMSTGIEILDLGQRRLYVKTSTGFVLHNDDLTPEELLVIATDIASHDKRHHALHGKGLPSPIGNLNIHPKKTLR